MASTVQIKEKIEKLKGTVTPGACAHWSKTHWKRTPNYFNLRRGICGIVQICFYPCHPWVISQNYYPAAVFYVDRICLLELFGSVLVLLVLSLRESSLCRPVVVVDLEAVGKGSTIVVPRKSKSGREAIDECGWIVSFTRRGFRQSWNAATQATRHLQAIFYLWSSDEGTCMFTRKN